MTYSLWHDLRRLSLYSFYLDTGVFFFLLSCIFIPESPSSNTPGFLKVEESVWNFRIHAYYFTKQNKFQEKNRSFTIRTINQPYYHVVSCPEVSHHKWNKLLIKNPRRYSVLIGSVLQDMIRLNWTVHERPT